MAILATVEQLQQLEKQAQPQGGGLIRVRGGQPGQRNKPKKAQGARDYASLGFSSTVRYLVHILPDQYLGLALTTLREWVLKDVADRAEAAELQAAVERRAAAEQQATADDPAPAPQPARHRLGRPRALPTELEDQMCKAVVGHVESGVQVCAQLACWGCTCWRAGGSCRCLERCRQL